MPCIGRFYVMSHLQNWKMTNQISALIQPTRDVCCFNIVTHYHPQNSHSRTWQLIFKKEKKSFIKILIMF